MAQSVLFVTTDADVRELFGAGLRKGGVLPVFVGSAAHALSFYTHAVVSLTIFDFDLESTDAVNECQSLIASSTPVIVLTRGVTADMNRYAQAAAGSAAFIIGPCTPQELVWIVERVSEGERNFLWPESERIESEEASIRI